MTARRIACIGDGKMAHAVAEVARLQGHEVVAIVGAEGNRDGSGISRANLGDPDVAIEFTVPGAAVDNVLACIAQRIPVVVGTTGWYAQLATVRDAVAANDGSVFYAPNFSVGVALFAEMAKAAARLMRAAGDFDVHIVETHHAAKKDAPSGTAAALVSAMEGLIGRPVPTTSVRTGSVPGTHQIVFDAPFEQIRLTHEARDRRVFAVGAVRAAEFLVGRRGVFTMADLLHLTEDH